MRIGHCKGGDAGARRNWGPLLLMLVAALGAQRALCADLAPATSDSALANPSKAAVAPRYALVLPVLAAGFAAPAEALRAGFLAAARIGHENQAVQLFAHAETQAVAAFARAVQSGAQVVVGPLARGDVAAVLAQGGDFPPTLLLNTPDQRASLPERVTVLALSVEADARQLARLAWKEGRERIAAVGGDAPLNRRFLSAFADEAEMLGMSIVHRIGFSGDTQLLPMLRQAIEGTNADALLLALDAPEARVARSYLSALPAYASGQVLDDRAPTDLIELANVRFVEMPWLAQPDHPAVMAYPRQELANATLQRLYALGIDAYRVARLIAQGQTAANMELDGVTGQLSGRQGQILVREANALVVRGGESVPVER